MMPRHAIEDGQRVNVVLCGRHVRFITGHGGPGRLSPLLRAMLDALYAAGILGDMAACDDEAAMFSFLTQRLGATLRQNNSNGG